MDAALQRSAMRKVYLRLLPFAVLSYVLAYVDRICVLSTIGLVIAGMTMGTWWALVGMSMATMGFYGSKGPFFAMPPMFLSGPALAAGIAWINSLGNLGGFFGPSYVGLMKDLTGSYAGGLYGLALLCLVAAIVCAVFLHIPNRLSSGAVSAPAE